LFRCRSDLPQRRRSLRRVVLVNRRSLLALRLRLHQTNLLCEPRIFLVA
jgi:hypothetical protein